MNHMWYVTMISEGFSSRICPTSLLGNHGIYGPDLCRTGLLGLENGGFHFLDCQIYDIKRQSDEISYNVMTARISRYKFLSKSLMDPDDSIPDII